MGTRISKQCCSINAEPPPVSAWNAYTTHRQTTIWGLEERDVPAWYLGCGLPGSTLINWTSVTMKPGIAYLQQSASGRNILELGASIVAGLARADRGLTEREYDRLEDISESILGMSEEVFGYDWMTTQFSAVPQLITEWNASITDLLDRSNHTTFVFRLEPTAKLFDSNIDVIRTLKMTLLFSAIVVASSDGLAQAELDACYRMADLLELDRNCARTITDLVYQEQEVFRRYHALLRPGSDNDTDQETDIPIETAEMEEGLLEANEDETAPFLNRLTTIAQLEAGDVPAWFIQSGLIGTTFLSFLKKVEVYNGDGAIRDLSETLHEETGLREIGFRIVIACASGDGNFSDLERSKLLEFGASSHVEVDAQKWMEEDIDLDIAGLVEKFETAFSTFKTQFAERLGVLSKIKMVLHNPKFLFDSSGSTWEYSLRTSFVIASICVAAADGLARDEINKVYEIGDMLGVEKDTVRRVADLVAMEQDLYGKFHSLFRAGLDGA